MEQEDLGQIWLTIAQLPVDTITRGSFVLGDYSIWDIRCWVNSIEHLICFEGRANPSILGINTVYFIKHNGILAVLNPFITYILCIHVWRYSDEL